MDYGQIILKRLEEGTLARGAWLRPRKKDGREMACFLAAIVPECGEVQSPRACPAEVMPPWLARLTPWINDEGSEEKWEGFIRRFAATSKKWKKLTRKHEYAIRAIAVKEAITHTTGTPNIAICNRVIELCEDVASGKVVDEVAFLSARRTAAQLSEWPAEHAASNLGYEHAPEWAMRAATSSASVAASKRAKKLTTQHTSAQGAADRMIEEILLVLEHA